jgi:hypothetical protein
MLPHSAKATWYGLWPPKGTPKNIIARLNAAVTDALADPMMRARLADLGPGFDAWAGPALITNPGTSRWLHGILRRMAWSPPTGISCVPPHPTAGVPEAVSSVSSEPPSVLGHRKMALATVAAPALRQSTARLLFTARSWGPSATLKNYSMISIVCKGGGI